ncbi:MAG: helix-turn-helix domain-containing protein [Bacteroidota bacterium]|nr:helix-turn-helix domain-containing protein [Bacteroidota bacterium]
MSATAARAPRTMTHQQYIPGATLRPFISNFTYYKGYRPDHRIDRYLPNGNIEIIIDLTDRPKYIYDNQTLTEKQACKRIWISGMRDEFITIPSGLDAEMFIIEFKKGMAYPMLGLPLTEITGTVVHGELILDKVFLELRERLFTCAQAGEMFVLAERLLARQFGSRLTVNPFVEFAVGKILGSPTSLSIRSVADKTGYSARHFIRIFSDHVGVTPKRFLRIIRFQRAINEIEVKGSIPWAALAYDCGYYDQAHFISDFKSFSGLTPLEYMRRRNGDFLNYVPVG